MTDGGGGITADADNVRSMRESFSLMVGRMPGSSRNEGGGVSTCFAHAPLSFFNLSVLNRAMMDAAEFTAALELARTRAETCVHPSLIAYCPSWAPADADALIAAAGLSESMKVTGMAADTLAPARRAAPPLDYRLAGDPAVARDLGFINAMAYGVDAQSCACIAAPALWAGDSFGVVGYAGGRAVSATAAFVVHETIYIACVATLPEAYGQGYAEAVMRHAIALAQAAAGPRRIWLHATEMGAPLYRSMGFETGAALPLLQVD